MFVIFYKYGCCMMVIKYMELWDGSRRCNGKNMLEYSTICNNLVILLWLYVFLVELVTF